MWDGIKVQFQPPATSCGTFFERTDAGKTKTEELRRVSSLESGSKRRPVTLNLLGFLKIQSVELWILLGSHV